MGREFESLQAHQAKMVGVAQLVRVPGCGPGGRGFEPLHSPHFLHLNNAPVAQLDRVADFESVGRRFESYRAYQNRMCSFSSECLKTTKCTAPVI